MLEQLYELKDEEPVSSPLIPVIVSFYMEDFEMTLDWTYHNPLCRFHYVNDTFFIWPHGAEKVKGFLEHLDSVHQNIQFTKETERDSHLPFLASIFPGNPMAP
jgi:hypothetical protein